MNARTGNSPMFEKSPGNQRQNKANKIDRNRQKNKKEKATLICVRHCSKSLACHNLPNPHRSFRKYYFHIRFLGWKLKD